MLKDRLIVADGETGWQVLLYERPGWQGGFVVLADGLCEEDAEAIAEEYADKVERRRLH